jgi:pimeloyl-ACP methyl ester carboxylesterase
MGQEYIRSHRSLLKLAQLLSSAGFDVLRFDYYGCGDSDGGCSEGSVKQWVADISAAVDELNGGCNLERMCLVGLRLAGALAMMAGAERGDIDSIVLWDAVIDGAAYLEELARSHNEWLRGSFARPQLDREHRKNREILGFPITDSVIEELVNINLLTLERKPANNVFIIESDKATKNGSLRECLKRIDVEPAYEYVPSSRIWMKKKDRTGRGLVPIPILKSIVAWISEVYR